MDHQPAKESYSVDDAQAHWSELVDKVEAGASIDIRRDGRTVARIVPSDPEPEAQKPKGKIDWDALKKLRDSQPMQEESAGTFIRRMRDDARY